METFESVWHPECWPGRCSCSFGLQPPAEHLSGLWSLQVPACKDLPGAHESVDNLGAEVYRGVSGPVKPDVCSLRYEHGCDNNFSRTTRVLVLIPNLIFCCKRKFSTQEPSRSPLLGLQPRLRPSTPQLTLAPCSSAQTLKVLPQLLSVGKTGKA